MTVYDSRGSYFVQSTLTAAIIIACHVASNAAFCMVTFLTTSSEENAISGGVQQGTPPPPFNCTSCGDGNHTERNETQDKNGCLHADNTVTQMFFPRNSKSVSEVTGAKQLSTSQKTFEGHGSDHLYLNYTECINRIVQHRIIGSEESIYWSFNKNQIKHVNTFCAVELFVSKSTLTRVQVVRTEEPIPCGAIDVTVLDDTKTAVYDGCPEYLPTVFFFNSSIVVFNITVSKIILDDVYYDLDVLTFSITTLTETRRPQLDAFFTSPTTGYLVISNQNSNESLPPFTKTSVHLTAPQNHMVVIHLEILDADCSYYAGNVTLRSDNHTLTFEICELQENSCTALAFYSGDVDVTYVTYAANKGKSSGKSSSEIRDFRIDFYFCPISQPPVQLSADRWSCATVNWNDVKPPGSCVFVFGCNSVEDVVGCWQADGNLQEGVFQMDGRCFAVSRAHGDQKFSWTCESEWCQQRGGNLASLSSTKLFTSLSSSLYRLGFGVFFLLGLRGTPPSVPVMYRHSFLWPDGTVAHFLTNFKTRASPDLCVMHGGFAEFTEVPLIRDYCDTRQFIHTHFCQIPQSLSQYRNITLPVLSTPRFSKLGYIQCPENHFTHVFLACDEISHCWLTNNDVTSSCAPPLKSLPLSFKCAETHQSVPYTLVCNHREDCRDGSDETFCYFPPCDVTSLFRCDGKRCVQKWEHCDNQLDCDDHEDEEGCSPLYSNSRTDDFVSTPAYILNFAKGIFIFSNYTPSTTNTSGISLCPDTHFTCVSLERIFLPVYLRCNGMYDCPGHEDEAACDSYTCPGFYRCRASQVCVHESHLCDGVYQCPQRDDEILCNETCPQHCVCHGWSFVCSETIHGNSYPNLRYLDASETRMTLFDVNNHAYLVYLSLTRCNLTTLHEVSLRNLRILDLSNNRLTHISAAHIAGLRNLQVLNLADNRLKILSFFDYYQSSLLKTLDILNNHIAEIDFDILSFFSELTSLNLSFTHLNHVTGQGFPTLNDLRVVDVRVCPMTIFPRGIFQALGTLETVFADSYKLCCPATLPKGFNVLNCHAPSDEVSSCDDLLRSNLYRVGLAIFASLALVGNVSSLLYRLIFHRTSSQAGYDIFMNNLCMADLLMGVYLLMIGIADQKYKGAYLWEDVGWRHSILCKAAGFVCFLSSEVSVFIIFLITVDRFLALRFPFHHLHFEKRSPHFACTITWLVGLVLAVIPLLPVTSHWQFYSQSSICIPLPTSRIDFPGRAYSYGVKVILNFILFICISIGQISIYWSVHTNAIAATCTSKDSKELNIARRLISVATLNLFCVFPVCFLGFLASNNELRIFGEVNIGIAIFVLPLNSALNPFLYTINIYLERRRRARVEKRRKYLMAQLHFSKNVNRVENSKIKMTRRDALDFVRSLLSVRALSPEDLTKISQDEAQEQ